MHGLLVPARHRNGASDPDPRTVGLNPPAADRLTSFASVLSSMGARHEDL